ncbi:MAG: sulfotransferase family protein [Rhodospirillaceae bacterium]|nr:sulfotransferase family protein [Rhodospirillaceae bacterium]
MPAIDLDGRANVARIAMWSGPRNLSTALMRAFENRADTAVLDEPLYAHYLAHTGLDHPGREAVLAAQPTDWHAALATLFQTLPAGLTIHYQKHMSHHLLPGFDENWLDRLVHCFLIRDPDEVVVSYARTREKPTLADLGYQQQLGIFRHEFERCGVAPPVIDARDLLQDPPGLLAALCQRLGLEFDEAMLSWPAGRRPSDGVWAPHWYASVEKSTGFQPYQAPRQVVPDALKSLAKVCQPIYREIFGYRLKAL